MDNINNLPIAVKQNKLSTKIKNGVSKYFITRVWSPNTIAGILLILPSDLFVYPAICFWPWSIIGYLPVIW